MTKQEVKELVLNVFKRLPGVEKELFENGLEDTLYDSFGLDSLDFVEALMGIEQEVQRRTKEKFSIDDEFAGDPNITLAMIINYVYDKVKDKKNKLETSNL